MVYFLLLVLIVAAADTAIVLLNRKKFGAFMFEITNPLSIFQSISALALLVVSIFCMGIYLNTKFYGILFPILTLNITVLMLCLHLFMKNGIGEAGVAIWGQYFKWSDIKSFKREDNIVLFTVIVRFPTIKNINLIKFTYEVTEKCRVKVDDVPAIEKFLLEHIKPAETESAKEEPVELGDSINK
jgi:hypothetical protein